MISRRSLRCSATRRALVERAEYSKNFLAKAAYGMPSSLALRPRSIIISISNPITTLFGSYGGPAAAARVISLYFLSIVLLNTIACMVVQMSQKNPSPRVAVLWGASKFRPSGLHDIYEFLQSTCEAREP